MLLFDGIDINGSERISLLWFHSTQALYQAEKALTSRKCAASDRRHRLSSKQDGS